MALAPVGNGKPLTLKDRQILTAYFSNGMNATQAYFDFCEKAGKPCTRETAEVKGSQWLKRIRRSGDFRSILEAKNLDDLRLASELDRLLSVKRIAFSPTGQVREFDDGPTQAKATEMLKDVLGHNSPQEINLNGSVGFGVLRAPKQMTPEEWAAAAIAHQSAMMAGMANE